MAEAIIDGLGSGYLLKINQDGSINISGIDISIGSLALSLEHIYVTSGTVNIQQLAPTHSYNLNPAFSFSYVTYSGTTIGTGSVIGSVIEYIGGSSYTFVLGYDSSYNVTTVGSWY
jgi:acetyltransferase-like isoleucine patch superfamily enzyme